MQLGYFHVIADPVSDCVHDIFAVFAFAQSTLGDEVENTAGVVIARETSFVPWNISPRRFYG